VAVADSRLSTPAPALSVIVVSHDSGAPLRDCLQRVLHQALPGGFELLLVDNASRDDALASLPPDPRLQLLRNADNRGFAVACNQGAARARADTLLFLNPDCLLPDGALQRLLAALAQAPAVGLLGAQLLDADGRPQAAARRRLPTLALRRRRGAAPRPVAAAGLETVEATSGALMLLPRRVFDAVGGFDEGYVLHCEDLDLCRRVRAAGHQVAVLGDLEVVHIKGVSSRRRPWWVEWQKHRGMLRYLRKFECRGAARALYPLLWAGVWLRFPLAGLRAWRAARRAGA
jgi:N-acetylglucosaminyl-diphospho-decaprenol L-rhamnosyltransferase